MDETDNRIYWDISKLKNWKKNPRNISKVGFERLKYQIQKLGQYKPLVIKEDGTVLGGNMRLRAYKDMGIKKVWVSIVKPKDKNEEMEFALSDNDRAGYYDSDLLANVVGDLDLDWSQYAVDVREPINMGDLMDAFEGVHEDDAPEVDETSEPVSKQGELYDLGNHRLYCGDATKQESYDRLLGGLKGNMIFTDPPYNVDYRSPAGLDYASTKFGGTGGKIFGDDKTDEEALQFYIDSLLMLYDNTTDSACVYWWFANKNNWINRVAFETAGWHMSQVIIWLKNSMVFSKGQDYHRMYEPCMFGWKKKKTHYTNKTLTNMKDVFNLEYDEFEEIINVWYQKRDLTTKYMHPTQKPVRLAERGLKKNSKPGDIVLDVFGGSGSTLIACHQMDRKCYMMELDPKYCDVIRKRYAKFTGQWDGEEDTWQKVTPKI